MVRLSASSIALLVVPIRLREASRDSVQGLLVSSMTKISFTAQLLAKLPLSNSGQSLAQRYLRSTTLTNLTEVQPCSVTTSIVSCKALSMLPTAMRSSSNNIFSSKCIHHITIRAIRARNNSSRTVAQSIMRVSSGMCVISIPRIVGVVSSVRTLGSAWRGSWPRNLRSVNLWTIWTQRLS